MADLTRLRKEMRDLGDAADTSGVWAQPLTDADLTKMRGYIRGPSGTPYEGGLFELSIDIPSAYPFSPPIVKFVTKIYHPNISSQTGVICLDILKSTSGRGTSAGAWSPALTIKTTLLSICALLSAPEPTDPQDAEVANVYLRDRRAFDATARFWTETYAAPPAVTAAGGAVGAVGAAASSVDDAKVEQLVAMGFAVDAARAALRACKGDVAQAIERLFSS